MFAKFAILVLGIGSVLAQVQPLTPCASTNPLVGLEVDVLQRSTAIKLGTAKLENDCTLSVKATALKSSSTVEIVRRNQKTGFVETPFIGSFVALNNPFFQLFLLKSGEKFSNGDRFDFMNREEQVLAVILLNLPVTTTTTTSTTTTTRAPTSTAATLTSAVVSSSPTIPGSSTIGKVYNPGKLVLVTLGSNPNYPNQPTTQDVSFYINNVESPVLTLVRGNDYTFSIMAGARHPFYLTTSIEGGKKTFPDSEETIFLGNSATWGTLEAPKLLQFKPTEDMPNEFYYQCWNHTRMGWKVVLINPGQLAQPTIPPLVTTSPGKKVRVGLWVSIVMMLVLANF